MISGVILDGKNRKPTLQSISGKCLKVSFKFRNLIKQTRRIPESKSSFMYSSTIFSTRNAPN